ncbi:MAG: lipopolysaccharide biosynthesis protein [Candidatus Competibacteraceae bacterium]|nr:lipopolysaccharide biosynthesis protein [Candidatus Competibacteraceae bacterium]MBK8899482.1 lipopolysaccharide biosynthesis protein [Candidatus Competibacteraceae bacterium]
MAPPGLQRLLAGYLPVNLLQAAITLGAVMVFSRLLTPAEYGHYALATTLMLWVQTLLFYWLQTGISRFHDTARDAGRLPRLLATAYVAAILMVILLGGIGLIVAEFSVYRPLILAGLAALLARSLFAVGLDFHRAAHRVRRYAWLEGVQYLLSLLLGVLFAIYLDWGAPAPLLGLALGNLAVLLADIPYLARQTEGLAWSRDDLRLLAGYGLPLTFSFLFGLVVAGSDRFFIAWLMDESAVGVYAVAYALADRTLTILFNWVGMATVPLAFSALASSGENAARQVMSDAAKSLILLALPAAVGLAAAAAPLAVVVVGPDFRATTAHIVPWIALAGLLNGAMVHYAAHAFLITRRTRALLGTTVLAAAVNVTLNVLLIPVWGLNGAIAATIVAYAVGLGARLLLMRTRFPIPLALPDLMKGLAACALMWAVLAAIPWPPTWAGLLAAVATGMACYGVAALLLNVSGVRRWVPARWFDWGSS